MSNEFEFTSRYDVFGPPNGCRGDCEGTGWVPIDGESLGLWTAPAGRVRLVALDTPDDPRRAYYTAAWLEAEAQHPTDDGYHFVRCPTCASKANA